MEPILPLLLTVVLTRQLSKIQHSTHRMRLCVLCESRNKGESKNVKFTIEPATKAHFFFNLGGRWGCWSTPLLGRFTPGKETRYLLCSRLGLPQDQSGWVGKISSPPGFCISFLLRTHNTNIHAPGGNRARNPSKRAASNPRLRPLSQGKRFDPRPFQILSSRCTDSFISAHGSLNKL